MSQIATKRVWKQHKLKWGEAGYRCSNCGKLKESWILKGWSLKRYKETGSNTKKSTYSVGYTEPLEHIQRDPSSPAVQYLSKIQQRVLQPRQHERTLAVGHHSKVEPSSIFRTVKAVQGTSGYHIHSTHTLAVQYHGDRVPSSTRE